MPHTRSILNRFTVTTLIVVFALSGATWLHARAPETAAASAATAKRIADHTIVISVDGMKPQTYTEPDAHGLKIPVMRSIMSSGAYSDGVLSVMPTVTYPSHTAMVTGVNPLRHGIYTNPAWDPFDRNTGGYRWYFEDIKVPTVYELAHARGLTTALIHWPVTVGAVADINLPEVWRASIPEDLKLVRALSTPPGIFTAIEKEYPDFDKDVTPPLQKDSAWTDAACYAITHLKPNLLFLHYASVDFAEHRRGPFSAEAVAATEDVDAQIGRVIDAAKHAGTWNTTILFVVSDHGFAPVTRQVFPGVLLKQKGLVTADANNPDRIATWKATVITDGGSAYIYINDAPGQPPDQATRDALLALFQPSADPAAPNGVKRIALHDEIVKMGGDPTAFLAIEAADGTVFSPGYKEIPTRVVPGETTGTHGYFPDRPDMRASLLIAGPGTGKGKIENAKLIDIAPTVARLLSIDLKDVDGSPLTLPAPQ